MGVLRRGVCLSLEEEADRLLKESLQGVTSREEKSDILTPWKLQERLRREVMVPSGTPDSSLRQGYFHRSLNPASPHLNSRDGTAQRGRRVPLTDGSEPPTFAPAISAPWDSE